jgi:hypothetical protein
MQGQRIAPGPTLNVGCGQKLTVPPTRDQRRIGASSRRQGSAASQFPWKPRAALIDAETAELCGRHILVCFLAYAMWKTLEQWQSRAGLGNSPRTILQELAAIHSAARKKCPAATVIWLLIGETPPRFGSTSLRGS